MDEKCLYEVESRDYVLKKLELVMVCVHILIAFLLFASLGIEVFFVTLFLGILIYFLLIKKMISRPSYTKIKFYSDKLCLVGEEQKYINYTDIKAILRSKGVVYIIIKDKETYLKNSFEENIEYNQIIKLDNSAYNYSYNKVKEITKANDLYKLAIENTKEQNSEIQLKFDKKCNMIMEYITLLIATAGIVTLLAAVCHGIDMFFPLNMDNVILFLCISFVATLIICWRNFKFNKKTIQTYEFYSNYIMDINNKTSFKDKIDYSFITKLKIKRKELNKCNVCIEFLQDRLRVDYQHIEKVLLSDVTIEEVEKIKDLIKKAKNIETTDI